MGFSGVRAIGLAILTASVSCAAISQPAPPRPLAPPQSEPKTGSPSAAILEGGEIQCEFDDPRLGIRWLLMRDPRHPGGPGLMVPVATGRVEAPLRARSSALRGSTDPEDQSRSLPVIRTGDRLIVEESTAMVEARLEAVALGPAQLGSPLNVRLVIGGKVLRVVVLGPGHAYLAPIRGAQP